VLKARRCSQPLRARPKVSGGEVKGGEGGDDLLGFEGDGDDLADEPEDVFGVGLISFKAVGVVDDAGAGVGGDAVLVDNPGRSALRAALRRFHPSE
jgi:hypothetical protein